MSWHTPTHSAQMKTVGPAISFRTSFWLLLQNEHRRTSSLFFFTDSLFVCYGPSSSLRLLLFSGCALPGLRFAFFRLRPAGLALRLFLAGPAGLALRPALCYGETAVHPRAAR